MKQQHQLRYHTQKKCGVCQQQFANQMELKAHYRQNHEIEHNSNDEAEDSTAKENESNFRCDTCGICESSVDSLSEHIALHDNQLKCVVCGTILKHKANLVLHMRIHVSAKRLFAFMFDTFSKKNLIFIWTTLDGQEIFQMRQVRKDFRPQIIASNAFANDAHRSTQKAMSSLSGAFQNDVTIESTFNYAYRRKAAQVS